MRSVRAGICSVWLLVLACAGTPDRPPSYVFIMIDTLRADYLGCYGFDGPISPGIDKLSRESFVFRRCYSAAPWTKPSIASLFTSMNPIVHGVTNHDGAMWGGDDPDLQKGVLRDEAITLAERLGDAGYRTAAFVTNPWITPEYGFDQGFDHFVNMERAEGHFVIPKAERWIQEGSPDAPFFLYLHFMEVHAPYDAPDGIYEQIRESPSAQSDLLLPRKNWGDLTPSLMNARWARNEDGRNAPESLKLSTWKARYGAGVRDLDNRLGPFLRRLEEEGVLEHSYVVVTSDHGEELYDHKGWEHGYTVYEDQILVPLLIRPPGGLPRGTDIHNVVGLIDLFPSILGLSGLETPEIEGKSLVPLLEGQPEGGSRVVLSTAVRNNPGLAALRVGDYKLILDAASGQVRLFNVESDPRELKDLSGTEPRIAETMRASLIELMMADGRSLFEASDQEISADRIELLKSLGYMN